MSTPVDPRIAAALEHAGRLGEVGIQVAAYLNGEQIVDAWSGSADPATGEPVTGDTLFVTFSVTKGVTATALHLQAERGLVDYEAPVAEYWPEFGANGKDRITVREVLTHRSGVPQMPDAVTPEQMCDWEWMIRAIERLEPLYPPGSTNAYHKVVFGWIIGEIVRRTDPLGRPFDAFVREEILTPLGIDDLYLGVPDDQLSRVAPVLVRDPLAPNPDPVRESTLPVQIYPGPTYNRRDVRQSVGPGAGAIMTARAGAQFFAMLAGGGALGGVRLLSSERLEQCTRPRADALSPDPILGYTPLVGAGGYWLGGASPPAYPVVGRGERILGHPGAGGSIAWADLDTGLSAAIFHNMMHGDRVNSTDPDVNPFLRLADAIRDIADESRPPAVASTLAAGR
jgi:CubicO group peptidase (beta-lactamase class C family)